MCNKGFPDSLVHALSCFSDRYQVTHPLFAKTQIRQIQLLCLLHHVTRQEVKQQQTLNKWPFKSMVLMHLYPDEVILYCRITKQGLYAEGHLKGPF